MTEKSYFLHISMPKYESSLNKDTLQEDERIQNRQRKRRSRIDEENMPDGDHTSKHHKYFKKC